MIIVTLNECGNKYTKKLLFHKNASGVIFHLH